MSLGDVCKIVMGSAPPSPTHNDYGKGLPFLLRVVICIVLFGILLQSSYAYSISDLPDFVRVEKLWSSYELQTDGSAKVVTLAIIQITPKEGVQHLNFTYLPWLHTYQKMRIPITVNVCTSYSYSASPVTVSCDGLASYDLVRCDEESCIVTLDASKPASYALVFNYTIENVIQDQWSYNLVWLTFPRLEKYDDVTNFVHLPSSDAIPQEIPEGAKTDAMYGVWFFEIQGAGDILIKYTDRIVTEILKPLFLTIFGISLGLAVQSAKLRQKLKKLKFLIRN